MRILILLSCSVINSRNLVHEQDIIFIVCNEPSPVATMSSHSMDGWWFPKEESQEEKLPFDLLFKVKTPPLFIVVGFLNSVDNSYNSIPECTGPWNLDTAPDVLDFIQTASHKASALCYYEMINNCLTAAKDLLICHSWSGIREPISIESYRRFIRGVSKSK